MDTLKGAWKTNLKVRLEKDWEKLEGRAITKDKNNDFMVHRSMVLVKQLYVMN